MHYSSGLEYIVGNSYLNSPYTEINYFSKNLDDNCGFKSQDSTTFTIQYTGKTQYQKYKNHQYPTTYANHSFTPEIFLNPSRPKTIFIDDNSEIKRMVEETLS